MLYVRGDAEAKHMDSYPQGLERIGVPELAHAVVPGDEFTPPETPKAFVATLGGFCQHCDAIGR
ncbi:hypothetical protein CSC73_13725 [Pseudoxanthomonas sacheonensis]|nr:hypothetical protein CSC73_13725 [Pseudoxanthomonas sacheonensis]